VLKQAGREEARVLIVPTSRSMVSSQQAQGGWDFGLLKVYPSNALLSSQAKQEMSPCFKES